MKTLIAGACLTIMAAGGYYGFGEYQKYRTIAERNQSEFRTIHIYSEDKSEDGVHRACNMWQRAESAATGETLAMVRVLLRYCRNQNYL